jgi:hypothetical protein
VERGGDHEVPRCRAVTISGVNLPTGHMGRQRIDSNKDPSRRAKTFLTALGTHPYRTTGNPHPSCCAEHATKLAAAIPHPCCCAEHATKLAAEILTWTQRKVVPMAARMTSRLPSGDRHRGSSDSTFTARWKGRSQGGAGSSLGGSWGGGVGTASTQTGRSIRSWLQETRHKPTRIPSGFLVVFEKPNRSSFTFTYTARRRVQDGSSLALLSRGQRAEGRGQRAEGRGQRAEGRGQRAEGTGPPVCT